MTTSVVNFDSVLIKIDLENSGDMSKRHRKLDGEKYATYGERRVTSRTFGFEFDSSFEVLTDALSLQD